MEHIRETKNSEAPPWPCLVCCDLIGQVPRSHPGEQRAGVFPSVLHSALLRDASSRAPDPVPSHRELLVPADAAFSLRVSIGPLRPLPLFFWFFVFFFLQYMSLIDLSVPRSEHIYFGSTYDCFPWCTGYVNHPWLIPVFLSKTTVVLARDTNSWVLLERSRPDLSIS